MADYEVKTIGAVSEDELQRVIEIVGTTVTTEGSRIILDPNNLPEVEFTEQVTYEKSVVRTVKTPAAVVGGNLVLNMIDANNFVIDGLTANITSVVIQNGPGAGETSTIAIHIRLAAAGLTFYPGTGFLLPESTDPIDLGNSGTTAIITLKKAPTLGWAVSYKRNFA